MSDLISRKEAIKAVKFYETFYDPYPRVIEALENLPSAQPKTQKLLDDGTLMVHTDIDITKITRVNITQNNTHYGDLFYRDEE